MFYIDIDETLKMIKVFVFTLIFHNVFTNDLEVSVQLKDRQDGQDI